VDGFALEAVAGPAAPLNMSLAQCRAAHGSSRPRAKHKVAKDTAFVNVLYKAKGQALLATIKAWRKLE